MNIPTNYTHINESTKQKLSAFISTRFKVKAHKIPYYLKWINQYLIFSKKLQHDNDNPKLRYLNFLTSRYQNWQVEQADKAINIYMSFLKNVIKKTDTNEPSLDNSNWDKVMFNMKNEIRLQNKSLKTEKSYLYWAKQFRNYADKKEPQIVNQTDVKAFLTYLVIERQVSISTQRQAFNAVLFLFRHILNKEITNLNTVAKAKSKRRLPVVLSAKEISEIIKHMYYPYKLLVEIIYGGGLRLSECLNLRIKDIDFKNNILEMVN